MGLDMYLYEIVWTGDDLKVELSKPSQGQTVGAFQEIAYWRKAWMIHHWFEENCNTEVINTGYSSVSSSKLKELRELCFKILSTLTSKQRELIRKNEQPDMTPRQKKLCKDVLNIDEAWWSPIDEIQVTYDNLKDLDLDTARSYLYWPWW